MRVTLGDSEREDKRARSVSIIKAKNLLKKNGFVIIDNVFEESYIDKLRDAYLLQLEEWRNRSMHERQQEDSLEVGDKREQVPVWIEGLFNDPDLYANFAIERLSQKVLGRDAVLGGFGSVVSFPGAESQHVHRDVGKALFKESPEINYELPVCSLTVTIPLVEINSDVGGTCFWPKSHLDPQFNWKVTNNKVSAYPKLGGCAIWTNLGNSRKITYPLCLG